MKKRGWKATIDGVGNVMGRSRQPGKALLAGSHSDTQPTGRLAGWRARRDLRAGSGCGALAADKETRTLRWMRVSFQDEESRFVGCLGSRSLTGTLSPEVEKGAVDNRGVTLADALREAGLAEAPRFASIAGALCGFR